MVEDWEQECERSQRAFEDDNKNIILSSDINKNQLRPVSQQISINSGTRSKHSVPHMSCDKQNRKTERVFILPEQVLRKNKLLPSHGTVPVMRSGCHRTVTAERDARKLISLATIPEHNGKHGRTQDNHGNGWLPCKKVNATKATSSLKPTQKPTDIVISNNSCDTTATHLENISKSNYSETSNKLDLMSSSAKSTGTKSQSMDSLSLPSPMKSPSTRKTKKVTIVIHGLTRKPVDKSKSCENVSQLDQRTTTSSPDVRQRNVIVSSSSQATAHQRGIPDGSSPSRENEQRQEQTRKIPETITIYKNSGFDV